MKNFLLRFFLGVLSLFFVEHEVFPLPQQALLRVQNKNLESIKKTRCVKIALEGMAGAGKTTSLLQLIPELEGTCVVLSELLPEPRADWSLLSIKDQSKIYHDLWVSRMKIIQKLSSHTKCFFLDRTYFTNLAFSYATDRFLEGKKHRANAHNKDRYINEPVYEKSYPEHKKLFLKDLQKEDFDLLIVLDVDTKIGLTRRHKAKDKMPWLSSEEIWLGYLRDFYYQELPKFYKGKILYIDTEKLSQDEVVQKIRDKLQDILEIKPKDVKRIKRKNLRAEEKILAYGLENDLGVSRSSLVYVFGYPTIYFRKYSVQLVDDKIIIFNNYQLNSIVQSFLK